MAPVCYNPATQTHKSSRFSALHDNDPFLPATAKPPFPQFLKARGKAEDLASLLALLESSQETFELLFSNLYFLDQER